MGQAGEEGKHTRAKGQWTGAQGGQPAAEIGGTRTGLDGLQPWHHDTQS